MYCHCMDYVANPIVYRGMVSLPCVHGKSWFVALSLHHLFYIVLSWFIMYYLCLFPWTIGNSRYSRYGASLLIPIHWHFRTNMEVPPPISQDILGPLGPPPCKAALVLPSCPHGSFSWWWSSSRDWAWPGCPVVARRQSWLPSRPLGVDDVVLDDVGMDQTQSKP